LLVLLDVELGCAASGLIADMVWSPP